MGVGLFLRREQAKQVGFILNYIKVPSQETLTPNRLVTLLKVYCNSIQSVSVYFCLSEY